MRRLTKRDLAISLHNAGRTVEEIARSLETSKTFVSQTIGKAGLLPVNLPPYETMVPLSKVQELEEEIIKLKGIINAVLPMMGEFQVAWESYAGKCGIGCDSDCFNSRISRMKQKMEDAVS